MREIHLGPGDVLRLAVESDGDGARVIVRLGNGRWRPMTADKARAVGELFIQAADEVGHVPARAPGLTTSPGATSV